VGKTGDHDQGWERNEGILGRKKKGANREGSLAAKERVSKNELPRAPSELGWMAFLPRDSESWKRCQNRVAHLGQRNRLGTQRIM